MKNHFSPGKLRKVQMYVRSMGHLLRVHAVFGTSDEEVDAANALMARNNRLAVVAETDGMILLADKYEGDQTDALRNH